MFDLTFLSSNKTIKNVLMLLLVVAVLFVLYKMYSTYMSKEGFETNNTDENVDVKENMENQDNDEDQNSEDQNTVNINEMMTNSNPVDRDMQNAQMMGMGMGMGSNDQLTAQDLLPQDKSSTWASVNAEGEGSLANQNFLQAGYHIGINTTGQTLRNANLQLRSEPSNPQVQVSPWLQSTIEPDVSRRPMEIGGCA